MDSSVIEVVDLTEGAQVAEYESNVVPPNSLVDELLDASKNYGDALICPERNSVGSAVIAIFRERQMLHLLVSEKKLDVKKGTKINRYGFHTTMATKSDILFKLKEAIEEGDLVLRSRPLLRELRGYTSLQLRDVRFDEEVSNHFDRVMAIAITNNMRFLVSGTS